VIARNGKGAKDSCQVAEDIKSIYSFFLQSMPQNPFKNSISIKEKRALPIMRSKDARRQLSLPYPALPVVTAYLHADAAPGSETGCTFFKGARLI